MARYDTQSARDARLVTPVTSIDPLITACRQPVNLERHVAKDRLRWLSLTVAGLRSREV
jgi:hypothetical protein